MFVKPPSKLSESRYQPEHTVFEITPEIKHGLTNVKLYPVWYTFFFLFTSTSINFILYETILAWRTFSQLYKTHISSSQMSEICGNIQWYKTEGSYRFVVACLDLNLILTNCLYKNLTCSNQLSTKVWTISKTREHSASTKWLVFTLLRIFECVDLTWLSQLVKAWLLRQWDILYTKASVKFRWVQGLNWFSQIPAHMCLYKYTK